MDRGHEALNNTKVVVDDLCEGSQTVGSAGRVGDLNESGDTAGQTKSGDRLGIVTYDLVLGVIVVEVNTADEHGSISGRGGDDNLLGAALQVGRGPISK